MPCLSPPVRFAKCVKCGVVFTPIRRRKVLLGWSPSDREIFLELVKQKEFRILKAASEAGLCGHMRRNCSEVPCRIVNELLKRKSPMAADRRSDRKQNFIGEHLWVGGYAVSQAGFELEQTRS